MNRPLRTALLGGGTIARLVLEQARQGALPGVDIVALAGRSARSPAAALARDFGVKYLIDVAVDTYGNVCFALAYFDIRIRKEGFDLEVAARQQVAPAA